MLIEAGAKDIGPGPESLDPLGIEVAADWSSLNSTENYLGYARTENFAAPDLMYDKESVYVSPLNLSLNHWARSGNWTVQKQSIVLNKATGRIVYRFHARDLHMVMGPSAPGASILFRVLINSKPPGAAHGIDVDEMGNGKVTSQRLYQLIRQPKPISDCDFEIEFLDSGLEAFSFTFG